MPGLVGSVVAAIAALTLGVSGVGAGLPGGPVQLASELNAAQRLVDARSASTAALTAAGRFIQLATRELRAQSPSARRATLAGLDGSTAATMRANLAAAAALSELGTPRKSLPAWRIIRPPAPDTLLGYFKAAQAGFGVPWEYLAAIEMIETQFGRVDGLSTAGAEGPMQFIPSTWAAYGSGNVHNPRDAIFAAARYLVANGAPR
jgi:membrane-bound lytic murein transglycosylase B